MLDVMAAAEFRGLGAAHLAGDWCLLRPSPPPPPPPGAEGLAGEPAGGPAGRRAGQCGRLGAHALVTFRRLGRPPVPSCGACSAAAQTERLQMWVRSYCRRPG